MSLTLFHLEVACCFLTKQGDLLMTRNICYWSWKLSNVPSTLLLVDIYIIFDCFDDLKVCGHFAYGRMNHKTTSQGGLPLTGFDNRFTIGGDFYWRCSGNYLFCFPLCSLTSSCHKVWGLIKFHRSIG